MLRPDMFKIEGFHDVTDVIFYLTCILKLIVARHLQAGRQAGWHSWYSEVRFVKQ